MSEGNHRDIFTLFSAFLLYSTYAITKISTISAAMQKMKTIEEKRCAREYWKLADKANLNNSQWRGSPFKKNMFEKRRTREIWMQWNQGVSKAYSRALDVKSPRNPCTLSSCATPSYGCFSHRSKCACSTRQCRPRSRSSLFRSS